MAITPQNAQQRTPGGPDSTKPASLKASTARRTTHAVSGPTAWENGRDPVAQAGGPVLRGAAAPDVDPACM
jgi:hypothetical protein